MALPPRRAPPLGANLKKKAGSAAAPEKGVMAVAPVFKGDTIVIVAGGPSLTADQVNYCRGRARVLVINDGYLLAPWADALYACDFPWWSAHDGVADFAGLKFTQDERPPKQWPDVHRIAGIHAPGLSLDPDLIHFGGNSGYQAINLAVHLGAKRIVLLGFDLRLGDDGKRHWFGDHRAGLNNPDAGHMARWLDNFATMIPDLERAGVEVINCTPGSALECFDKDDLHATL